MTNTEAKRFGEFVDRTDLGYNAEGKERFRRDGMRLLRECAKRLGLPKGTYTVRWNPGGIAVSGDCILHSDSLYVNLSQSCMRDLGFMYRHCNGQKDYTGGINRWFRWSDLADMDKVLRGFQEAMEGDPSPGPAFTGGPFAPFSSPGR